MMRWMAAVAGLIGLAGCASPEKFEAELDRWIGRTEVDVVEAWGPPSQVYENDAGRYLTWQSGGVRLLPGHPTIYHTDRSGSRSRTIVSGSVPPTLLDLNCKKTMILQQGVIKRWRWEGNNCF